MLQLNQRLIYVSEYIQGDCLADIGSDHAYLPIYALEHHLIRTAIAGEVIQGPYEASIKNVRSYGYDSQIDVRLGDGLSILTDSDHVDTITICGMGGPLIAQILQQGASKLKPHTRLVLQSNVQTEALRRTLEHLDFEITQELIFKEKGHIYELVVADYQSNSRPLTKQELKFGPILLRYKNAQFIEKWQREVDALEKIKAQLDATKHQQRLEEINAEIEMINEVLKI